MEQFKNIVEYLGAMMPFVLHAQVDKRRMDSKRITEGIIISVFAAFLIALGAYMFGLPQTIESIAGTLNRIENKHDRDIKEVKQMLEKASVNVKHKIERHEDAWHLRQRGGK